MFNHGFAQTLEHAFKAFHAFAGIHQYTFRSKLSAEVGYWLPENYEAIISIDGSELSMDATTLNSGEWFASVNNTRLPRNFLVELKPQDMPWGIGLCYQKPSSQAFLLPHWEFRVQSDGSSGFYYYNGSYYQELHRIPDYIATPDKNIQIAVRELYFSDQDTQGWLAFSLWENDRLVNTFVTFIGVLQANSYYMGVSAKGGTIATFDPIRISELTEFVEWNSIDPGETAGGGLQRAIEGRYTKYRIRYDGSLQAWKPGNQTSVLALDNDDIEVIGTNSDKREFATHIRMVGAYHEAEYVRDDLGEHRFQEINNPYLMSTFECYQEAVLSIYRQQETATQYRLSIPYIPLIEPEDRISVPFDECVITGFSLSFSGYDGTMQLDCRRYIERPVI